MFSTSKYIQALSVGIITMTLSSPQILTLQHFGFETSWFRNFSMFFMVSVSVSEKIGIEKSIGIGFENFWYRKKFRYWFRKNLVSKKVSVLVSKIFGIDKSIGLKKIGIRAFFWPLSIYIGPKVLNMAGKL